MNHFISVYLLWHGRASRKTYWIFSIPIAALWVINQYWVSKINESLSLLLLAIIIYPATMINIKRCHDRNRTGFFSLLLLIPLISLWPLIELGFIKGTEGSNKYGEEDLWQST